MESIKKDIRNAIWDTAIDQIYALIYNSTSTLVRDYVNDSIPDTTHVSIWNSVYLKIYKTS